MNKKVLLVIVAMMVIAGNAWAADVVWLGGGAGDPNAWSNPNNWDTGVPNPGDKAKINLVNPPYGPILAGADDVNQLYVAESAGAVAGAQTLEVSGVLDVNAEAVLGYGADDVNNDDGKLLVTGTGIVNCNQHLFVGYDPCATGRLHIEDTGTVNVAQMFGLSWNGGDGLAQLDGGTLITEEFTFENVAGGTALMNITGGKWIQKHFWWDEIRALVWNGKITGYGQRKNVVVTWDPNANDPNEDRTIVTALVSPAAPGLITVISTGGGDYDTIQKALDDVNGLGLTECSVIEVQDNATYTENLVFPDVNYLTLQAGDGNSPTITVSGTDANTHYINMKAVGQTIQGFDINFSGSAFPTDSNSAMILSQGGRSTVRDCTITGPASGWIMGITAVATIEDVELSNCRVGIVCDLNEVEAGFSYSITGCHLHDNRLRGMVFNDCNAVVDDCLLERSGTSPGVANTNILTTGDANIPNPNLDLDLNLLVKNSTIRDIVGTGRNLTLEARGTVTVENCIILGATYDEILQYQGTLNLNRCIVKCSSSIGACVNRSKEGTQGGGIANIDHCSIEGSATSTQWAVYVNDDEPNAAITITNSILTGPQGLFEAPLGGEITTNWNDNFCDSNFSGDIDIVAGPNDFNPGVDPFYIQVNDVNLDTFFALQPYSPVVNADENGSYMGAKGPMTGYERWPGSFLDGVYGSDFSDFAVLALRWRDSNVIPIISPMVLDTFESYTATGPGAGTLLDSWEVMAWNYDPWIRGSSTLTLLTDPCDANSGSKAMRWEYDVNVVPPDVCEVGYTEIAVILPAEVNLAAYNELRVSLKRHTGNSPNNETFMFAKFYDITQGMYPAILEKWDQVGSLVGGDTASHPDEYYDWTINLDDYVPGPYGTPIGDMTNVGAILFGIQTQPEGPYGHGTGTIDVDDIRLIDLPGCSGNPVGDLADESTSQDCEVTLDDVRIFARFWLEGK